MSNTIYDVARMMFGQALIDWRTAPLRLFAYSGNPDFHADDDVISDITSRGSTMRISVSQDIITQTVTTQGYLMTDNVVFQAVPIGYPLTHFIMVLMPGTDPELATPLLFTDEADDLPFTPNGLDIVVTPDWLQHRGWGRL